MSLAHQSWLLTYLLSMPNEYWIPPYHMELCYKSMACFIQKRNIYHLCRMPNYLGKKSKLCEGQMSPRSWAWLFRATWRKQVSFTSFLKMNGEWPKESHTVWYSIPLKTPKNNSIRIPTRASPAKSADLYRNRKCCHATNSCDIW